MTDNKTIRKIQDILQSYELDCWLLYTDEGMDPYFKKYITDKTISITVCIITRDKCYIIANSLDFDNLQVYENVSNVRYTGEEGNRLRDKLQSVLTELGHPPVISLSYSTLQDVLVDVLGHGSFLYLTEKIDQIYQLHSKAVAYNSAENIMYALADRKNEEEVAKLRLAAQRANEILDKAFAQIRVGMTEIDIVQLVHDIFNIKPDYFKLHHVIKEEYSWNKDFCPVVLAGPSLMKGGHAVASDLQVREGFTIYFDFGVKLFFEDGTFFSSDIQRMGYILRSGESAAPKEVQDIFQTLYDSISLGIQALIPGKKGHEVDTVVRGYIKQKGYIDYDHSTGHSIGETAHSPGTLLGPGKSGMSTLLVQPLGVYTIEPRIPIDNGGSIEEMVLATPDGGIPVSPRQTSLYLVSPERK